MLYIIAICGFSLTSTACRTENVDYTMHKDTHIHCYIVMVYH